MCMNSEHVGIDKKARGITGIACLHAKADERGCEFQELSSDISASVIGF